MWGARVLAVIAALAATPAVAAAQPLYTSPSGSTTAQACLELAPCSFDHALTRAQPNDEVIVGLGHYPLIGAVSTSVAGLDIHGAAFAPDRPMLTFTSDNGLGVVGAGSHVSDLDIRVTQTNNAVAGTAFAISDGVAERIFVSHDKQTACRVVRSTLRDSSCYATLGRGVSVEDGPSVVRNVTANGGMAGIVALFGQVTIVNSIARALAPGTSDLSIDGGVLTVSYSNFITHPVTGFGSYAAGAGNQTVAPLLGEGNRELANSPTIGAGTADGVVAGELDEEGDARAVDIPDIGADEAVRAAVATTGVGTADHDSATFTGTIDPGGSASSWHFDYSGPDGLVVSTPSRTLRGSSGSQPVSFTLTGLREGLALRFRLILTTRLATVTGDQHTITTVVSPPPGLPRDTLPPIVGSARLSHTSFAVSSQFTALTAAARRPPRGATLSFKSSEAGVATIAVQRARDGRRSRGACVQPTRKLREAKKCTRYVAAATLMRSVVTSTNRFAFSGRLGSSRPEPPPRAWALPPCDPGCRRCR